MEESPRRRCCFSTITLSCYSCACSLESPNFSQEGRKLSSAVLICRLKDLEHFLNSQLHSEGFACLPVGALLSSCPHSRAEQAARLSISHSSQARPGAWQTSALCWHRGNAGSYSVCAFSRHSVLLLWQLKLRLVPAWWRAQYLSRCSAGPG